MTYTDPDPLIFVPKNDIPYFYNKICDFYEEAGAGNNKQEEHITIQLGLEVARHVIKVNANNNNNNFMKPWIPLDLKDWKTKLRDMVRRNSDQRPFAIAPSTKPLEYDLGFDVIWYFANGNKGHTYYLQAKRYTKKKEVDFIAPDGTRKQFTGLIEAYAEHKRNAEPPEIGVTHAAFGGFIIYGDRKLWLVYIEDLELAIGGLHEDTTDAETKRLLAEKFCTDEYLFENQFRS